MQVHTERLAQALRRRGYDPQDLNGAFWRTLVLLDHQFSPDQGVWDDWVPQWIAEIGHHSNIPSEDMLSAWREADNPNFLWDLPIPGAAECLRRLRDAGVRLGVVSNADGRIGTALERAELAEYFEVIVDSGVVGVAKPDPAIFDHALEPLGLRAENTWYIGDTVMYDAAAAEAAGLTAWVIDHQGLHTLHHPRRVGSLAEFADLVIEARS